MEIIISSLIGALSAILVAYLNSSRIKKKKQETINDLVKELNVNADNIIIVNSQKLDNDNNPRFYSKASEGRIVYIIK
jgi:hypothetical protein